MTDDDSYGVSTTEDYAQASAGQIRALEIALVQMMRVISQGLKGEEAYEHIARGLRADAESLKMMPGLQGKAFRSQLNSLASTFEQPPRG